MTAARLFVLLLGTVAPLLASGQTRDATSRAGQAPPERGRAALSGVVTSLQAPGQPVRRVTVSLFSSDLRVPVSTTTDDNGRFTFTGVVAGNYGVVASKAAFIGSFFGSAEPGHGPGVPVAVRDGERIDGITLVIARGGVIAGTVRLPSGRPADGMTVLVTGVDLVAGARRPVLRGGRAVSDDRGEYRVYGLPAGGYVVQVQPSGFLAGAPSGTTDARQTSASEVSWAEAVARQAQGASPMGPVTGRRVQYAKVFYPGTTDASSPRVVSLDLGEERVGVDVTMELVATARVAGTVLGPDGAPLSKATIALIPANRGLDAAAMVAAYPTVASGDDGAFELTAIAPGQYRLSMRRAVTPAASGQAGPNGVRPVVRALAEASAGSGDAGELWAEQTLVITGQDVEGVTLFAQPGLAVSGRLRFEASSMTPPSTADLARARVTLVPRRGIESAAGTAAAAAYTTTAAVSADGEFRFRGVVPGSYRITFAMPGLRLTPDAPGGGWSLRSVLEGDVDVLDALLEVAPGATHDALVAIFTDHPSEFVGSLTDQAARPAPGYPIVVFSTQREDWTPGSRRVTVARPATDGTFRLTGLPPGRYHVVAVVSLDDANLEDPSFLEQLVPGALTITVREGARTTQDLRLAGG